MVQEAEEYAEQDKAVCQCPHHAVIITRKRPSSMFFWQSLLCSTKSDLVLVQLCRIIYKPMQGDLQCCLLCITLGRCTDSEVIEEPKHA